MSVNRRGRGPRKAYLKHTVSKFDNKPDETMKASIGKGRNLLDQTPVWRHRTRYHVLDPETLQVRGKWTPTLTEPMREKLEKHYPSHFGTSTRVHVKEREDDYLCVMYETSLFKLTRFSTTLDEVGCYWFSLLNKLTEETTISFTYSSKSRAMKACTDQRILWKPME